MSDGLLEKIVAEHTQSLRSVQVDREIPTTDDLHLMTIYDDNVTDPDQPALKRARDACQLMMNSLWQETSHETIEGKTYAILPMTQQKIFVPREKPLPKEKKATKWELFAQTKGINNKKKSRMVYDEDTKNWIPRWGYKPKRSQKDREWAIEVPNDERANTDMFQKRTEAKNKSIDKNEFNRLRNIARNSKKPDKNILGINPTGGGDKHDLSKAFAVAKKSTASLGKFDNKVRGENEQRVKGLKRKFLSNSAGGERERMLKLVTEVQKGDQILNAKKAAGRLMAGDQGAAGTGKKKEKLAQKGKIGMKSKAKKAQRAGRNANGPRR